MAERTLRGARLGGQSFEDERGIEFAARQQVGYRCPQNHVFEITMSVEADVPAVWECPRCGAEGLSTSGIEKEVKNEKPVRTHWDMLLERRSEKELEDILKTVADGQERADDRPDHRVAEGVGAQPGRGTGLLVESAVEQHRDAIEQRFEQREFARRQPAARGAEAGLPGRRVEREFARADQRAFLNQISQVACRRGEARASNRSVVSRA